MHEAQLYDQNCFLTLTFADEHLPENYSVDVRDLQLFMKRLRKETYPRLIRFYAVGEYGDLSGRPHYHALIFNYDFSDKNVYSISRGNKLYTSSLLSKLWPYGLATLGSVTPQSAAYCARYSMKKIGGKNAAEHYTRLHPLTGKFVTVRPEFSVMSRRPGIGTGWFERFRSDIYPSDYVIVDGHKQAVPRFYKLKLTEEEQLDAKRRRKAASLRFKPDQTKERRHVRATVRDAKIATLKRKL